MSMVLPVRDADFAQVYEWSPDGTELLWGLQGVSGNYGGSEILKKGPLESIHDGDEL